MLRSEEKEEDHDVITNQANSRKSKIANSSSWFVNWFLLFAKIFVVIVSSSKAVTAALADSAVDLISQAVLSLTERYMRKHSPDYPVGRSRLEALGVLGCACIMSMASIEVIQYSLIDLYNGCNGRKPALEVGVPMFVILGIGLFFKLLLFLYCRHVNKSIHSDTLEALAEDHFNDILSNSAAIATATIAFHTVAWWLDPVGAIVISAVIIARWGNIMLEQVRKVVGYTAPPEFLAQVNEIAQSHDERLLVDCTRAYYFGSRYNVEMEVVMPASMTVAESHDVALALQHKIEGLRDVERAFVHVDYLTRDGLEHKVERELVRLTYSQQLSPFQVDPNIPLMDGLRSRQKRSTIPPVDIEKDKLAAVIVAPRTDVI